MRQKNSYSRIIQGITDWEHASWGDKIRLFQHSVEKDITSFLALSPGRVTLQDNSLGTALSESGLSRDEIQLMSGVREVPKTSDDLVLQVEQSLEHLKTDYLDLFFLDLNLPTEIVIPAVERLFSQGKILETGVYNLHEPSVTSSIEKNSIKANLTTWKFTPAGMKSLTLKAAPNHNLTEMVWINLWEINDFNLPLEPFVQKYEHTAQEILLSWFLQHPAHFHPVIEGHKIENIDSAAKAHHLKLIDEDWKNLPKRMEG